MDKESKNVLIFFFGKKGVCFDVMFWMIIH